MYVLEKPFSNLRVSGCYLFSISIIFGRCPLLKQTRNLFCSKNSNLNQLLFSPVAGCQFFDEICFGEEQSRHDAKTFFPVVVFLGGSTEILRHELILLKQCFHELNLLKQCFQIIKVAHNDSECSLVRSWTLLIYWVELIGQYLSDFEPYQLITIWGKWIMFHSIVIHTEPFLTIRASFKSARSQLSKEVRITKNGSL